MVCRKNRKTGFDTSIYLLILALHSLAAASRPRLSETEQKWFTFGTFCYAFGGRNRRFAKVNVNKFNIVLLYHTYSSCILFFSM